MGLLLGIIRLGCLILILMLLYEGNLVILYNLEILSDWGFKVWHLKKERERKKLVNYRRFITIVVTPFRASHKQKQIRKERKEKKKYK